MRYIKVRWKHPPNDYPVLLFSELDDVGYEIRKVEVFADGRMQYASAKANTGDTMLSIEPIPAVDEIAQDPEFEPVEINEREFEDVWARATNVKGLS
jgi:hypothetical protein